MWDVFTTVATNSGTTFEYAILIIAFAGGIIFYAKGYQLGTLLNFFIFAAIFAWFYSLGLNWSLPLIITMMYVVLLALSFYPSNRVVESGGFI